MSNEHTDDNESTDIEPRTRRALERVLTVTDTDGTPISDDETPTVVSVHSGNSGKEHRVDVREGRCTCPDHEHRGAECKHIRRARVALGRDTVDARTIREVDVDPQLGAFAPGPRVAASDGGVVGADSDEPTVTVSVTDSGALRRHESDNEPSRLLSRDADLTPL